MYFVYECYDQGTLLFRSIGKDGSQINPVPLSSPELRAIRKRVQEKTSSLTYSFVAAGLSKSDAEKLLLRLNAEEAMSKALADSESNEMAPICWHPECGQRLTTRQLVAMSRYLNSEADMQHQSPDNAGEVGVSHEFS